MGEVVLYVDGETRDLCRCYGDDEQGENEDKDDNAEENGVEVGHVGDGADDNNDASD